TPQWQAVWGQLPASWRDDDNRGSRAFGSAFLDPSAGLLDDGASDFCIRWAAGIAALDRWTGVDSPRMGRVGRLSAVPHCTEMSWERFAAHLVHEAPAFAAAYNAALAEYRQVRGIRTTHHPVPDLVVSADRVELPLWAWRGNEPRRRVYVVPQAGGTTTLWALDEPMGQLARGEELSRYGQFAGWSIRPRALTL